ncbi:MAG TPA: hypothetical protein VHW26_08655 [Solirubrobacteraceae bacterium]|nr:hypothetical protein [Solirubrobacteraceae bacterium]
MSRRRGRRLALVVGVGLAFGLLPGQAVAGTFHAYSCHTPDGEVAPTDGWTGSASGPEADDINDCAGTTTYALTAALDGVIPHAADTDYALWSFSTSAGLTIQSASLYRHEGTPGGVGANSGYVTALYAPNFLYDAGDVFDDCQALLGCSQVGTNDGGFSPSNHEDVPAGHISGASHLYMSADCGGSPGAACPAYPGYAAEADLYAADLTLSDDSDPTATNVGGPLLAGGTLTGDADVVFNAADVGSGVYSASVIVDGTTVSNTVLDPNGGHCKTVGQATDGLRDFLYQVPCKTALTGDVDLDTSKLTDGSHALRVVIDDAAGNTATIYSGTITTHNAAAPISAQGGGLTGATPSGTTGATGATGATSAGAGTGTANGTGACENPTLTAHFGGSTAVHVGLGKRATLAGTLTCAGHGVGAGLIDLSITPEGGSLKSTSSAVRTAADGTFAYALGGGPSRAIRLTYQAFSGDAGPSASASAQLLVKSSVALTVGPKRTTNGRTIIFRGHVYGGYIPAAGLTLNLEYRDGTRWRPFDQTRARGKTGTFVYRYTFKRTTVPIIYKFRVAIPGAGVTGYPYEAAASRSRSVRVDP